MEICEPYKVTHYPQSPSIPPDRRDALLGRFDEIMDQTWHKHPDRYEVWEASFFDSFFSHDNGLVLTEYADEIVGFWIYQRLLVRESRVLYSALACILPAHQGKGLRKEMARTTFPYEIARVGSDPLYHAWRTRNPIGWSLLAKMCKSVVPNFTDDDRDPALVELGRLVAKLLYPDLPLEIPSMIMRGAYTLTSFKEEPRHVDPAFNAAFHASLANKQDAIFSIGELRRS